MKNYFLVLNLVLMSLLFVACGKAGQTKPAVASKLDRVIDPQTEGKFSISEQNLGNTFCAALKYKRENFLNLHTEPTVKKFQFKTKKYECGATDEVAEGGQTLFYSAAGGISYAGSGSIPLVQTDSQGIFATYCANKTQESRVFVNGGSYISYHFYEGTACSGEAFDICAVAEKANKGEPTNTYKQYLVLTGSKFGYDLKGQELRSIDQSKCADNKFVTSSMELFDVVP
jgi:hypothetical protein